MLADFDHVAHMLLNPEGPSLDTIRRALEMACQQVERLSNPASAENAKAGFLHAVGQCGSDILDGASPQRLENAVYTTFPASALEEQALRRGWITFSEEVNRVSGHPVFGGDGWLETWAMTACSQPWPYVAPPVIDQVLDNVSKGQHLVIVRGPGREAFLAAVRRRLLAETQTIVSPIISAAFDDIATPMRNLLDEGTLPADLKEILPKLNLGEDLVGLFGRLGENQPVALVLNHAHMQARSFLLGLPIFLEPSSNRDAALICAAPDSSDDDGALADVIADARARGILTEVTLPDIDDEALAALWVAHGGDTNDARIKDIRAQLNHVHDADLRWAVARSWCQTLAGQKSSQSVEQSLLELRAMMPKHPAAVALLKVAAHEGRHFHGATLATVLSRSSDEIEDILHDEQFTVDGSMVGGCTALVPLGLCSWASCPQGLIQLYSFQDPRAVAECVVGVSDERRSTIEQGLLDSLIDTYGREDVWKVAGRLWRLANSRASKEKVLSLILGPLRSDRAEAAFRRFLPVLTLDDNYFLGLSRLYGAGMEAGTLGVSNGKPAVADQAFQAAAASARRLGRGPAAGEAMGRLGELRLALALPEAARAALTVATQLLDGPSHRTSRARLALLVAEVSILEGDFQRAADELSGIVDEFVHVEDWSHQALALMRLGRILYEIGRVDESDARLKTAMAAAEKSGDLRAIGAACLAMAFPCVESDLLDDAFKYLQEGAEAFKKAQLPVHLFELQAADLQRRNGQPKDALARFSRIADIFKEAKAAIQWSEAKHGEIRCLVDCGRLSEAHEAIGQLKALRLRARDRFGLVRLFVDEGDISLGLGDQGAACFAYCCARELSERYGLRLSRVIAEERLVQHSTAFDKASAVDVDAIETKAMSAIDKIEADWQSSHSQSKHSQTLH